MQQCIGIYTLQGFIEDRKELSCWMGLLMFILSVIFMTGPMLRTYSTTTTDNEQRISHIRSLEMLAGASLASPFMELV